MVNKAELVKITDQHRPSGTWAFWYPESEMDKTELETGQDVRLKTRGNSPFICESLLLCSFYCLAASAYSPWNSACTASSVYFDATKRESKYFIVWTPLQLQAACLKLAESGAFKGIQMQCKICRDLHSLFSDDIRWACFSKLQGPLGFHIILACPSTDLHDSGEWVNIVFPASFIRGVGSARSLTPLILRRVIQPFDIQ